MGWSVLFMSAHRLVIPRVPIPPSRHSRESGNPFSLLHQSNMDSRFRGNDVGGAERNA